MRLLIGSLRKNRLRSAWFLHLSWVEARHLLVALKLGLAEECLFKTLGMLTL